LSCNRPINPHGRIAVRRHG